MHPNFDIKEIDDKYADLICVICGDTKRHTRKALKNLIASTLFDDKCPNCDAPYYDYSEEIPSTDELFPIGENLEDVIKNAKEHESTIVLSNLCSVFMRKENLTGLGSFSEKERYIYVIDAMLREVNNGGFEQFFGNSSGELTYDLVPALKAVGSFKALDIAEKAVSIFGVIPTLDIESREHNLDVITKNYTIAAWEQCDESFYELSEQVEKLAVDYFIDGLPEIKP